MNVRGVLLAVIVTILSVAWATPAVRGVESGDAAAIELDVRTALELAREGNIGLALSRVELEAARVSLEQARAQSMIAPSPALLNQAESAFEVAERDLALAEQSLLLEVEEAYYNVLRQMNLLRVLDEAVEIARRQRTISSDRYRAGAATELDLMRAEIALSEVEVNRTQAQENLEVALTVLRQTIGVPGTQRLVLDETIAAAQPPETSVEEAIAEALSRRVEIVRAASTLEVAQKEVELANNDYTPALTLARARVQADRAALLLRQARNAVVLDVQGSHNRVLHSFRRLELTRRQVAQAERHLEVQTALFDAGLASDIAVLEAQTDVTEARTAAVNAVFDYNSARAAFYKAIGRGPMQDE